jgi:serine/threonine protein kinase
VTTVQLGRSTGSFGPYLLRGLIGRGGMGEVRAVDTSHEGRMVALKLLPPEVSDDPDRRDRFRRESEIVARLGEPHVIPVHRYGEIDGGCSSKCSSWTGRTSGLTSVPPVCCRPTWPPGSSSRSRRRSTPPMPPASSMVT